MTLRRSAAALLAFGAIATILMRIWLRMSAEDETIGEAIWALYRFYTIWINTLIGLACAAIAVGRTVTVQRLSNLLLSIIIVAVVYHALLASRNNFTGMDALVDTMLHTVIPLAFFAFWIICVAKSTLRFRDIIPWLGLPLLYCIYAMLRAQLDGVYPYFFLNLAELGPAQTTLNIVGLLIAFATVGALIVLLARGLNRIAPVRDPA